MSRKRSIAVAFAIAASAAVLGASAGAAGRESVTTEFAEADIFPISPTRAIYRGKLESKKRRCEVNRKVIVIHDSDPPFIIGEATTTDLGFRLVGPLPPPGERVIFRVEPRDISTPRRERHCKGTKTSLRAPEDEED